MTREGFHAAPIPRRDTTWMDHAACAGGDPGLWMVDTHDAYTRARAWCVACPVRRECLEDAMATEAVRQSASRATVRGGLSPDQRANLAMSRCGLRSVAS